MKTLIHASAAAVILTTGLAAMPQSAEAQYQTRGAPRCSYQDSCSGSYVNQGRLYADCRDERGRVRETSIQLNRCSSDDIGNRNGRLVCGGYRGDFEDGGRPGGGWDGGGPDWGGNGRGSITVFKDANFRGEAISLRGPIPNLRASGFNDRISSMRFRGEWIACTDADFRGECQSFRNDVRNLDRWGMNDRISSLRPAGRY